MASSRDRADRLVLQAGLAPDLQTARGLIMAAKVLWTDPKGREMRVQSPGQTLRADAQFRVKGKARTFVSRGGDKLEHALATWELPVQGHFAVDAGISTGGFTDCLLRRGARRVVGIDVGYGDVDPKIRQDPRVELRERTHVRHVDRPSLGEAADLVVADLSFIRLAPLMAHFATWLAPQGGAVVLVKPQFELDPPPEGGVVRDPALWRRAMDQVRKAARDAGFEEFGWVESPKPGPKGNREFVVGFRLERPQTAPRGMSRK